MEKPVPSQVCESGLCSAWSWVHVTLCPVRVPGHQREDHLSPAEAEECDSENSTSDQLQAGGRAVGRGHTHSECVRVCVYMYVCLCASVIYGSELFPQKSIMVVGIDVYHDSVSGKSRSIVGFVASTNP